MERTAHTKDRLLEAGANILSTSGFSGISIGGLAQQTGMSKSGLFAHFGSKDALGISLLERTADLAARNVVAPAMGEPEGIPRLRMLVDHWFGWYRRTGLDGGCAIAAGLFELDDAQGPVRDRLSELETNWRTLLSQLTMRAVELGQFRADLDVDQFVWELCGIYLTHHVSARFLRDTEADRRAATAFEGLIQRSLVTGKQRGGSRKGR